MVAIYRNGLERIAGDVVLRLEVTPADRDVMRRRLEKLNTALRSASMSMTERDRVATAVATMLTGWMNVSRQDPRETVAGYVVHLQDLPAFAVEQACHDAVRGHVDGLNPDFPPSAPRLHQLAEEACAAMRGEAAGIREVLSAKLERLPTEAERARIGAGFAELRAELTAPDEKISAEAKAESENRRAEANRRFFERDCAAAGVDPAQNASPSLIKALEAQGYTMPVRKHEDAA